MWYTILWTNKKKILVEKEAEMEKPRNQKVLYKVSCPQGNFSETVAKSHIMWDVYMYYYGKEINIHISIIIFNLILCIYFYLATEVSIHDKQPQPHNERNEKKKLFNDSLFKYIYSTWM